MTTYRQLKQQIAQLEKKAAIAMKEEVRKAIESIKQQIAEFGLTAADLGLAIARRTGARTAKGKKLVLAPKYREPGTGKTWNGHGKRPAWIVAAQKKGKLEELAIAATLAGQGAGEAGGEEDPEKTCGSGQARGEKDAEETRAGCAAHGQAGAEEAGGTAAQEAHGCAQGGGQEACGEETSGDEDGSPSHEACSPP